MRKKFVTWYAEEIKKQMDAGIFMQVVTLFNLTHVLSRSVNTMSETIKIHAKPENLKIAKFN